MLSQATIRHGTGPDGDSISPPDNVVRDGIFDGMGASGIRPTPANETTHPGGGRTKTALRWSAAFAGMRVMQGRACCGQARGQSLLQGSLGITESGARRGTERAGPAPLPAILTRCGPRRRAVPPGARPARACSGPP